MDQITTPVSIEAFRSYIFSPPTRQVGLGDADGEAELAVSWKGYLNELADKLELGLVYMEQSYDALREYLSSLGLPLFSAASPDGFGLPTTWTKDLQADYDKLRTMVDQGILYLREAADGKRSTVVTPNGWGIQGLPDDPFAIGYDKTTKQPVMMPVPTEPASLGAAQAAASPPFLLIAGVIVMWIGIIYVLYVAVKSMTEVIKKIYEDKESQRIYTCLDQHTPEECKRAQDAVENLKKLNIAATNANKPEDPLKDARELLGTIAWVGVAGAGVYLAVTYGPKLLDSLGSDKKKPA